MMNFECWIKGKGKYYKSFTNCFEPLRHKDKKVHKEYSFQLSSTNQQLNLMPPMHEWLTNNSFLGVNKKAERNAKNINYQPSYTLPVLCQLTTIND